MTDGVRAAVRSAGRPGEEAADIFLPAPRNLRQQLSRAAKALEEEQLSEAVDLLGQLLASPEVASDSDRRREPIRTISWPSPKRSGRRRA